jgi:hypothetical protein
MMRLTFPIAALLALAAWNRTPEERRVALQVELRNQVDALYAQFGGGTAMGLMRSLSKAEGKDGLAESARGPATALAEQYDRSGREAAPCRLHTPRPRKGGEPRVGRSGNHRVAQEDGDGGGGGADARRSPLMKVGLPLAPGTGTRLPIPNTPPA